MSLHAAWIVVALSLVAQDQPQPLPLIVTRLSIDACAPDLVREGAGNPRVEVQNRGTRTILAWGVKFELTFSDGRVEPGGLSVDGASVPADDRTESVRPRRTTANLTGKNRCGGLVVPADTVISEGTVTFVIFDDDTALGDEHQIALTFDRRRQAQMFWRKMQEITEQAISQSTDAASVLAIIRERMEADPDPKFRGVGYYQWFLTQMSPRLMAVTNPQTVLDRFRSMILAQKTNADAHSVRR